MNPNAPLEDRVSALLAGDPELMADPFPTWNELRDTRPVLRVPGAVVISRHRDVRELLGDNYVLYSRQQNRHAPRFETARQTFSPKARESFDYVMDQEYGQLVRMDPPDHPRVRKVLVPAFAARSLIREMEDKVRARVAQNLDALADLVNDNFGYDNDARRCEDKPLVAEVDRDLNRVVITRPNDWGLKGHLDDIMRGDYRRFVVGREDWEAKAAGHHFEPGMIVFDKPIHTTVPAGEEVRCPKPK